MALEELRDPVKEIDTAKLTYPVLYDLYLKQNAERPSTSDFVLKFGEALKQKGLSDEYAQAVTQRLAGELTKEGGQFTDRPEDLAKQLVEAEGFEPPASATPVISGPTFTEFDGFLKNETGEVYLSDRVTRVFPHPQQSDIFYDARNQLYQRGRPYTQSTTAQFTEFDGFLKNQAGEVYLSDRVTRVFPHPQQSDIFYDARNQFYQHGQAYVPGQAADGQAADETEAPADAQVMEFVNDPANLAEMMAAADKGELLVDYSEDDTDIDSFNPSHFANVE